MEPAVEGVPIPVAKKTPSLWCSQLKPIVSPELRSLLRSCDIGAYSTRFAATVSLEFLGSDSKEWAALMSQGGNYDNWTYFAPGCSVESLERWKRGATSTAHAACCRAVERTTGKPFPVEEVSAVEPDFQAEHEALRARIAEERETLISQIPRFIGVHSPFWKKSDHALGVPLHVPVTDISLRWVEVQSPFDEYTIQANYKGTSIPVGHLILSGNSYSLIYDARPFLWTGEDLTIGRKRIRLVLPKGDLVSHLTGLIPAHAEFDAIAS
ncbi:hypothetical protein N836_07155 [Leptolyngbya sp. Heron Island J]|nr:hypothetical protein N836_07155 [Leptolyngbya sp. Heron Island J]